MTLHVARHEQGRPVDEEIFEEKAKHGTEAVVVRPDERIVQEQREPFRARPEVPERGLDDRRLGAVHHDRRLHLRGEAGARQQAGARLGLAHVIGLGSCCAIHILEAPNK